MTLEGHGANVTSVCFHSEGKWLVTASEDQSVCIWDLRYAFRLLTQILFMTLEFCNRTASLHRKYDTGNPGVLVCICTASNLIAIVNDVVVHPNQGELISCDQNGKIIMWDLSSSSGMPSIELVGALYPTSFVEDTDSWFKVSMGRYTDEISQRFRRWFLDDCSQYPCQFSDCSSDITSTKNVYVAGTGRVLAD